MADAPRGRAFVVLICIAYICSSATLISFNKFLMRKDNFPFPIALSMIQMACGTVFSGGLYRIAPSYFPTLSGEGAEALKVSSRLVMTCLLPNAVLFSLQLVFGNAVYEYLSVAFIQMMKMSNVVFVYTLSVMCGVDRWALDRAAILLAIVAATSMTVKGERHFSSIGFVLQALSQVFGCTCLVLQGMVLTNGKGKKLDVLSYNLMISPITLCTLSVAALGTPALPVLQSNIISSPSMADVIAWWPLLVANAAFAYSLNIGCNMLVKHTSPVGLCLAGILKDAAVVCCGAVVHHEYISHLQIVGFVAQLGLIYMYATWRLPPDAADKETEKSWEEARDVEKHCAASLVDSTRDSYGAAR